MPTPCGSTTCVNAEKVNGGVLVTSTIPGNDGAVTFTHSEWDAFLGQVKAGNWDHTYQSAEESVPA
jgi:hypothetical protein